MKQYYDINGFPLTVGKSVQAIETVMGDTVKIKKYDVYTISNINTLGHLSFVELSNDNETFFPYDFQLF